MKKIVDKLNRFLMDNYDAIIVIGFIIILYTIIVYLT
jgi:hypothetical protein